MLITPCPKTAKTGTLAKQTAMKTTSAPRIKVDSKNVTYTESHILSNYSYEKTRVEFQEDGQNLVVKPELTSVSFKTALKPAKLG